MHISHSMKQIVFLFMGNYGQSAARVEKESHKNLSWYLRTIKTNLLINERTHYNVFRPFASQEWYDVHFDSICIGIIIYTL